MEYRLPACVNGLLALMPTAERYDFLAFELQFKRI
jgi:hypothetical protein